ncbi:four helix bundle protein [Prevotella sp. tf2-5]|uniref:four helix bundle protein n=1 Tax=Prevotella sp. tf2-5 TaxID=1761889 RepID=UPI0008E58452|nr:four helix bundle protein [Prevotella sp. tf2-5]
MLLVKQTIVQNLLLLLKKLVSQLYWIELLHRNKYIDDKQYQSIYNDAEELVKLLVHRCKKIDEQLCEDK